MIDVAKLIEAGIIRLTSGLASGKVEVVTGTSPHGQGHEHTFAAVVAKLEAMTDEETGRIEAVLAAGIGSTVELETDGPQEAEASAAADESEAIGRS